jgi:hypothetical protein
MALDVSGAFADAERAYRWLASVQRNDGAWAAYYRNDVAEDTTLDANFCAYVATGVWHHFRCTGDNAFLHWAWPCVERALDFVVDLQSPSGAVMWARDERGAPWPGALLTSCASIATSLRSGIAIAETLGAERPDWELALALLEDALKDEALFEDKRRFAMDWYYPVLSGTLDRVSARARLEQRWDEFVIEDGGCRCVSDRPWITSAETCELVMALAMVGRRDDALQLFERVQFLRAEDGAYWTGATWPDGTIWPVEKTTWSAAAVILAADLLDGGVTAGLFSQPELLGRTRAAPSDAVADPL